MFPSRMRIHRIRSLDYYRSYPSLFEKQQPILPRKTPQAKVPTTVKLRMGRRPLFSRPKRLGSTAGPFEARFVLSATRRSIPPTSQQNPAKISNLNGKHLKRDRISVTPPKTMPQIPTTSDSPRFRSRPRTVSSDPCCKRKLAWVLLCLRSVYQIVAKANRMLARAQSRSFEVRPGRRIRIRSSPSSRSFPRILKYPRCIQLLMAMPAVCQ